MKLKTVTQFSKSNEAFPEGGLRWLIHNKHSNGLLESGAIIKLGGRILIDEDRFMPWVETHNTAIQKSTDHKFHEYDPSQHQNTKLEIS